MNNTQFPRKVLSTLYEWGGKTLYLAESRMDTFTKGLRDARIDAETRYAERWDFVEMGQGIHSDKGIYENYSNGAIMLKVTTDPEEFECIDWAHSAEQFKAPYYL